MFILLGIGIGIGIGYDFYKFVKMVIGGEMSIVWFSRLSPTAKVMCIVEGILFIILLIAGYNIYFFIYPFERPLPYTVGLMTGCSLSAAKIILLERTISRAVDLGKQAKNYASLNAIVRYFGTIAAVAPAFIFRDTFGVYGVVAGLLTLQLAAFITSFIIKKNKFSTTDATAIEPENNNEKS